MKHTNTFDNNQVQKDNHQSDNHQSDNQHYISKYNIKYNTSNVSNTYIINDTIPHIVIIGSGCREYSFIEKLKLDLYKQNVSRQLICFKNQDNDMINKLVDSQYKYDGFISEETDFYKYIQSNISNIEFVFIGPENPLAEGIVDFLNSRGINSIGPNKFYSQIESSKIFCRNLLSNISQPSQNILTTISPKYLDIKYEDNPLNFTEDELNYILNSDNNNHKGHSIFHMINGNTYNNANVMVDGIREKIKCFYDQNITTFSGIVIKKDYLCGGKGVIVEGVDFDDKQQTFFYEIINSHINKYDILIEEKLIGEEFSLITFTDGKSFIHFPPLQDYKRLKDNDEGPNTGGMGCACYHNNNLPFLSEDDKQLASQYNEMTINRLNQLGSSSNQELTYSGILYGSYIKTDDDEIKLIEFNSRLGDPEAMVVFSLLESSLYLLCKSIIHRCLDTYVPIISKEAIMCLYFVPNGYPMLGKSKQSYRHLYDIYINDELINNNVVQIMYGNCLVEGNHLYSSKSRTLALISKADDFYQAYHNVYNQSKHITGFLGHRSDIGANFLSRYQKSGVSIENANQSLKNIKKNILATYNSSVISDFGSFGGEIKLDNNVIVASIDGVGSKSITSNKIYGIEGFKMLGKDIVGHSINDILVQGAKPLFFMDYFGTARLNSLELENFIEGVSQVCVEYGNIPILGGETAEMPLVYKSGESDLVGCIVGVKDNRFFNTPLQSGDILINLPSVGPHTNGFTLINDLLNDRDINTLSTIELHLFKKLLNPHKCYLKEVYQIISEIGYQNLKGMCHITGGGFYENMSRVVPSNLNIKLYNELVFPDWCLELQKSLNISKNEMIQVYNCGIGFVLMISKEMVENLSRLQINYEIIGELN